MIQILKVDDAEVCIPCQCQGSIKYVHRTCIQEWIKSSGAIECEICHNMYNQEWVQWAIENDYVKKDAEDEPELEDMIDKYCDKLKYFFIFVILVFILYFVIFFIMKNAIPKALRDDLIFLGWRLFVIIL